MPGTALADGNKAVNKSDKNPALTELIHYLRREIIFSNLKHVPCPMVTNTNGKNNKGGIKGGVGTLGLKLKCDLVKPQEKVTFKQRLVLPRWPGCKESACNAGKVGSIPGSERSPGEGNGNPFWYSCLGNPMDRGGWRAMVHGIEESQRRLSN